MTDLRVVSWNVNGLRAAARKGFLDWLDSESASVVGLQETRVELEQLTDAVRAPDGWHFELCSAAKTGYSGVGLYSRVAPATVDSTPGHDDRD